MFIIENGDTVLYSSKGLLLHTFRLFCSNFGGVLLTRDFIRAYLSSKSAVFYMAPISEAKTWIFANE